jgi:hypothetical protein
MDLCEQDLLNYKEFVMEKYLKKINILLFAFVFFAGTPQIIKAQLSMHNETIELERNGQFSLKIDVPVNWKVIRERGTPIPGTAQTYDLSLIPPSGEKALLIITIGKTQTGKSLTQRQFDTLINGRVSLLLPHAVEERAVYNEISLNNGYGRYCILTDASLVNKVPEPDDYIYLAVYFANYSNGCIVYSTLYVDDTNSLDFQYMLRSLSSIEPIFSQ